VLLSLNVGPTTLRADGLPGLVRLDVRSGASATLGDVTRTVIGVRAQDDPVVAKMLRSGIENPPLSDDDDRHPRAGGGALMIICVLS